MLSCHMLSQLYTGVQYLQPLRHCKTPEQLKKCALAWSMSDCGMGLVDSDAAVKVRTSCTIQDMLLMAGCTQPCISRTKIGSGATDVA